MSYSKTQWANQMREILLALVQLMLTEWCNTHHGHAVTSHSIRPYRDVSTHLPQTPSDSSPSSRSSSPPHWWWCSRCPSSSDGLWRHETGCAWAPPVLFAACQTTEKKKKTPQDLLIHTWTLPKPTLQLWSQSGLKNSDYTHTFMHLYKLYILYNMH